MNKHAIRSLLFLLGWSVFLCLALAFGPRQKLAAPTSVGTSDIVTTWGNENDGSFYSAASSSVAATQALTTEWSAGCVNRRVVITGTGMGDPYHTITTQTLSLGASTGVQWTLAQMVGRPDGPGPVPDSVTFITDALQTVTLTEPYTITSASYIFQTNLSSSKQITVSVNNPGGHNTPRGVIVYRMQDTSDKWSSVGKTTNAYVHRSSYTQVLTLPNSLKQFTDLEVTAIVIDNNVDARPLVLEATAGKITASRSITWPTHGNLLNIVSLTLPDVPTGTNQVTVTLRSPDNDGDSLVLTGLNVSYLCPNSPSIDGIFLPIIFREPTICNPYGPKNHSLTKQATLTAQPIIGYANRYSVEVNVPANSNMEYGLTFGHGSDPRKYYRFGIIHARNGIPPRFRLKRQYGSKSKDSTCITENDAVSYCGYEDNTINTSSNYLRIECDLNAIKLYVNRDLNDEPRLVWESDKFSCRGGIGIFLQVPSQQVTGIFRDFQISCPSNASDLSIKTNSSLPVLTTKGLEADLDN